VKALLRVANLEGVSERNPAKEARLALTLPGKRGLPDIVVFSEASWLNLEPLARDFGFHSVQYGEQGSPEAGVAIASRFELEPVGILVGSNPSGSGKTAVRMRPIVGADAKGLPVPIWAVHAPPLRSTAARAAYVARAKSCRGVMAGDWNLSVDWMEQNMQRHYRGNGVLGVLAPPRIRLLSPSTVDIDSDHPGVDIPLRWGK